MFNRLRFYNYYQNVETMFDCELLNVEDIHYGLESSGLLKNKLTSTHFYQFAFSHRRLQVEYQL